MALSRRMAAPFFLGILLVIVASETATARDVVDKRCLSQSHAFTGACWSNTNCDNVCKVEKFTSGECRMDGVEPKCFCNKIC